MHLHIASIFIKNCLVGLLCTGSQTDIYLLTHLEDLPAVVVMFSVVLSVLVVLVFVAQLAPPRLLEQPQLRDVVKSCSADDWRRSTDECLE